MPRSPDELLVAAAETFRSRNAEYGAGYLKVGPIMAAFFPNGIKLETPEDHGRYHLFMLAAVKMSRYAANFEHGHPDSMRDLAAYAAMLESFDEFQSAS